MRLYLSIQVLFLMMSTTEKAFATFTHKPLNPSLVDLSGAVILEWKYREVAGKLLLVISFEKCNSKYGNFEMIGQIAITGSTPMIYPFISGINIKVPATLEVLKVTEANSGTYRCTLQYADGSIVQDTVVVKIKGNELQRTSASLFSSSPSTEITIDTTMATAMTSLKKMVISTSINSTKVLPIQSSYPLEGGAPFLTSAEEVIRTRFITLIKSSLSTTIVNSTKFDRDKTSKKNGNYLISSTKSISLSKSRNTGETLSRLVVLKSSEPNTFMKSQKMSGYISSVTCETGIVMPSIITSKVIDTSVRKLFLSQSFTLLPFRSKRFSSVGHKSGLIATSQTLSSQSNLQINSLSTSASNRGAVTSSSLVLVSMVEKGNKTIHHNYNTLIQLMIGIPASCIALTFITMLILYCKRKRGKRKIETSVYPHIEMNSNLYI